MMSSGERSKGAGTCKNRPARNCPTRRDPCGRMSRPEKSLQALEKAQNGLGHDRPGPVGGRAPRPSPATGSATRPDAASPQSRRLASRSRPESKMAPQAVENAQNGLENGEAGTRARPTFPTRRPRRTAESPCGRPAMTRLPGAAARRTLRPRPLAGSQNWLQVLENVQNGLGNSQLCGEAQPDLPGNAPQQARPPNRLRGRSSHRTPSEENPLPTSVGRLQNWMQALENIQIVSHGAKRGWDRADYGRPKTCNDGWPDSSFRAHLTPSAKATSTGLFRKIGTPAKRLLTG